MLQTIPRPSPVSPPVDDSVDKYLVCPACGEPLIQPDVESFSRCPYCDHIFVKDQSLEDFLLEPAVRAWIRSQNILPMQFRDNDPDQF